MSNRPRRHHRRRAHEHGPVCVVARAVWHDGAPIDSVHYYEPDRPNDSGLSVLGGPKATSPDELMTLCVDCLVAARPDAGPLLDIARRDGEWYSDDARARGMHLAELSLRDVIEWTVRDAKADRESPAFVVEALQRYALEIPEWAWRACTARIYAAGLHYGYPRCCIEQFCRDYEPTPTGRYSHDARSAAMELAELDRIPCDDCVDQILEELAALDRPKGTERP